MEKKKVNPVLLWILWIIAGFMGLILIAGLVGSIGYKATSPKENPEAAREFYVQLKNLHVSVNTAYAMAAKKATEGNIQGAYADFKSPVHTMVKMGESKAADLERSVPNVPDKELLKEAANYLGLSFYKRDKAISAFLEGVEENNQGKFVESRTENDKADEYLSQATAAFEKIESKYGLGK